MFSCVDRAGDRVSHGDLTRPLGTTDPRDGKRKQALDRGHIETLPRCRDARSRRTSEA